jgi:hypothetical protein
MLLAELMRDQIASLERANEAASRRKQRKKKRLQHQGVLTKGSGEDILAHREADQQIAREERQGRELSGLVQFETVQESVLHLPEAVRRSSQGSSRSLGTNSGS